MSSLMFADQKAIDTFDEAMWDIHQMFTLGIVGYQEAIETVEQRFQHSPLMARRCVELWMPEEKRTVTNAY